MKPAQAWTILLAGAAYIFIAAGIIALGQADLASKLIGLGLLTGGYAFVAGIWASEP